MSAEYSPGSREIVAAIISIWQEDPSTESISSSKLLIRLKEKKADQNWVLSEKRMKAALKEFNLQQNQPKFTFVKETVSEIPTNFQTPKGIQLQMSKGKGKALYATKRYRAGDKIWEEEPLVQAGTADMLRLMRSGKACTYCAKLLRTSPDGQPMPRSGVACLYCSANWCSNHCKKLDIGHADTHHIIKTFKAVISVPKWKEYEQFCLENNWNAGFLYAMVLLHKIKHSKTMAGVDSTPYARLMRGMARIRQDVRQQAVSQPDSLEFEHHELMWKHGHELLSEAVRPVYSLKYDEYLEGIGMVNINNIRGCIFGVHANLNHNCEPNVKVEFKGESKADGIAVYARQDINPGQELVTSYVDVAWPLDQRQYELRVNWGFNCACMKCKRDRQAQFAPPQKTIKPALKVTPPTSPKDADGTVTSPKSVRFDKNPVSLEIPA